MTDQPVPAFQVGNLRDLLHDDPVFPTLSDALPEALARSRKAHSEFFGIWTAQDLGSELIAIIHDQEVFVYSPNPPEALAQAAAHRLYLKNLRSRPLDRSVPGGKES